MGKQETADFIFAFLLGAVVVGSLRGCMEENRLRGYALEVALKQAAEKRQVEIVPKGKERNRMVLNFSDGTAANLEIDGRKIIMTTPNNLNPTNAKIETDELLHSIKESLIIPKDREWGVTITQKPDNSIELSI